MKIYRPHDLELYATNDWILPLLRQYETMVDSELRTHKWLGEIIAKRMIYADVYGDILRKPQPSISVLDVGGGINSLTKLLAQNSNYTLLDFFAHSDKAEVSTYLTCYSMKMINSDWYDFVPTQNYDVVIANDIFPDVDQRLELFMELYLPLCHEMRLVITYYNSPRFYTTKRIDDTEIMTFLSWDGEITALKLKNYLSRMMDTASADLLAMPSDNDSVFRNGRQVAYIALYGDLL